MIMSFEYFDAEKLLSLEPGTPLLIHTEDDQYFVGERSRDESFSLLYTIRFPDLYVETNPYPRPLASQWDGIPLIALSDQALSEVLSILNPSEVPSFYNLVHYLLAHEFLDERYTVQLLRLLKH